MNKLELMKESFPASYWEKHHSFRNLSNGALEEAYAATDKQLEEFLESLKENKEFCLHYIKNVLKGELALKNIMASPDGDV